MNSKAMHLLWLRSDLRINDNTALAAACAHGPVIAVYLLSPGQWQRHDDAACKVDFWLRNLRTLGQDLAKLNIPLLIRRAETWDAAPAVLLELCRQLAVTSVHFNEEYGANESCRDQAVIASLESAGIDVIGYLDQLLFEPGSVLTKSGTYFQVFSQFRKVCHDRLHHSLPGLVTAPRAQHPLPIDSDPLPAQVEGFPTPSLNLQHRWPAGETQARQRLAGFMGEAIGDYQHARDLPALDGTSQLSAYLAAGVVSPRQCLHAALAHNFGEFGSGNPGVTSWINELLWREFYKHILVGYPRVSRHRAFRPETEALPWRNAPSDLAAWQEARTGFPIIDAALRQLLETGWMHNRLRMIVAMFLCKNLLIDWREGERFFMRHLIDGDLAANNGGWQWSASTGTDAAPYFRILNPTSQSEKFDPQGRFLRQWLPELATLDGVAIHNPAARGNMFTNNNYPQPIVDLGSSRQRALQAFKNLPHRMEANAGHD
ncbi:Deoxyribodipyrimidine photo-lyase [compost metagenome]